MIFYDLIKKNAIKKESKNSLKLFGCLEKIKQTKKRFKRSDSKSDSSSKSNTER